MTIQCDVRWNRHIFQCRSFLRLGKIFWSSYYLHHLYRNTWGLRLLDRVQERAKLFGYNGRVTNSIDSMERRCNVGCVQRCHLPSFPFSPLNFFSNNISFFDKIQLKIFSNKYNNNNTKYLHTYIIDHYNPSVRITA